MSIEMSYRSYRIYDDKIGWLYVPNSRFRVISDEAEKGAYFLKTNKQKFRSDFDFNISKGDKKRILFFGDSYTAGTVVDNSSRFTDLIGNRVNNLECYNFGLGSTGIDQQILIYEKIAKKYGSSR